ncbi:hypothetical protein EOL70_06685 [Leucothrix sargassi]|nr:hypothetical protein EOL70_06685 [Leucothrix sargassi]
MPTPIKWVNSAVIDVPQSYLYDYVSDISKDPKWRAEVKRMDVQGDIKVGTLAVEYSDLFMGLKRVVTPAEITILDKPTLFVCETPKDAKTWLMSRRELNAISETQTEIVYRLETEVPYTGILGSLYAQLTTYFYQPRLPKYLKMLKALVEEEYRSK